MKNLFKVFLALFFTVGFLNAQSLNQKNQVDGYDVEITSTRDLSAGSNELFANITKDGKAVTTAKVKVKFFMPEMPGMPYMEHEGEGTLSGDKYKMTINFCMNGTWQYQLKFKTDDGVVHTVKSSVNF